MSAATRRVGGAACNGLLAAFAAHAQAAPDAIAICAGTRAVSFAGLAGAAGGLADALARLGVVRDDIVAFAADPTPDTLALLVAIIARGAAYLPLDRNLPDARLAAMLEDARPSLLVADRALCARVQAPITCVDRGALHCADAALPDASAGTLAYVLFTSGSTGRPKGVAMRSAAVGALLDWHQRHPRLGAAARTLQFAPLGFDVSFQEIFSTLASGGTLIIPSVAERRDPWALLALLRRESVERAFLPYVALQALAEAVLAEPASTPSTLRDVVTAGEQLRITPAIRALFAALPGCVLHNQYGPTETHVVTAHELSGPPASWPELPPIGQPLPHVRCVIDSAATQDAEAGQGELLLGGACLAAGYVGQDVLTRQRFVELHGERWYRSGDRVRRDADGNLHFLGRLDDQVKIAGRRIEPGELETLLARHALVAQAAVVVTGAAAEARLVAHVVARDPRIGEAELMHALRRDCATALPDYLRPAAIVLHALLPVTASGKVDRRALQQAVAPAWHWRDDEPLAAQLGGLWASLLGLDTLDAHANLFDLGARSLDVIRALTELRRHGLVMSVAQVYEQPSVAAQARLLAAAAPIGAQAPAERSRATRQRAAFAQFARPGAAS